MRKDRLVDKSNVLPSIFTENQILQNAEHPFVANMQYFYTSDERMYIVMPFIGGGELSKILSEQ